MSAAQQIAYGEFDRDFFALPADVQTRIQRKLDEMGLRLASYPHYRMRGSESCRLRVGDYRIIYRVDNVRNVIHLLAVGHRREVYK